MKKPSVVVDTNIFISALIIAKSKPTKLLSFWRQKRFILVTSVPLIKELEMVLDRPKYQKKYFISQTIKQKLFSTLQANAHIVTHLNKPEIEIRDAKDLIVLATALDGKADYLVTGDNDLLSLRNNPNISPLIILTVDEFLQLITP